LTFSKITSYELCYGYAHFTLVHGKRRDAGVRTELRHIGKIVGDHAHTIFRRNASLLEIAIKTSRGKLKISGNNLF
jgi:hypothetical protein